MSRIPCLLLAVFPVFAPAALLERFEHDGHTYDIFSDTRTWTEAQSDAQSRSVGGAAGYLWNVNSVTENAHVFTRILNHQETFGAIAADGGGARYLWLGATDTAQEGIWRWTDGNANFWTGQGGAGDGSGSAQGGLYNNWGRSFGLGGFGIADGNTMEPDDYLNNQDVAAIGIDEWGPNAPGERFGAAGEWNDIAASNAMPYVVEYNAVAAIPEPAAYGGVAAAAALVVAVCRRRVRR